MLLVLTVIDVQAATIWIPNKSGVIDINTLTLTGDSFGICDDALDPNGGASILMFKTGPYTSDTISFTPVTGSSNWTITSINTGNSITLADSNHFKVVWNNGSQWVEDNGYTEATPDSQYWVNFPGLTGAGPGNSALQLTDVKLATPIPGAAYLFGAGLLTCIGLRNRRTDLES